MTKVLAIFLLIVIFAFVQQAVADLEKINRVKDDIKELQRKYSDLRRNEQHDEADALKEEMDNLASLVRGSEDSLNSRVPDDIPDDIRFRMEDSMKRRRDEHRERLQADIMSRHHHRSRSYGSKADMDKEKHEKFHDLIRDRVDDLLQRIDRAPFSAEEATKLKNDVDTYYRWELEVMDSRAEMNKMFEEARDIRNREDRLAHLEKARNMRETRRDRDIQKREDARQLRQRIDDAIKAKVRGEEL